MIHKIFASGMSFVLLLLLLLPQQAEAQSVIFSPDIVQTIENSRASNAFWSVIVRDTTGKILEGYNFDKQVRPASNLKLLTSAAILDELGADYTYSTKIYGLGNQDGDTWRGDIIIRGAGDPSISGKFYNEDRFHVFDKFFSSLHDRGIRKIEGNLIGNNAFFDQQLYPKGWSWQDLSFYYGVEISALSFNNNAVDLTVYANGDVGDTPRIEWFPFDTDYVEFVNEQVITPKGTEYDEFYRRILGTNTIILGSTLPQNYVEKESLSIKNASLFFLDTFKKYLEGGNISVTGHIIVDEKPLNLEQGQYVVLAEHTSEPLAKLLEQVNKKSDNFYAEMLLKTIAAEHFNTIGSTELGINLVKEFAASMKVDTTKLKMVDGAGMAPSTLLNTEDLSRFLVEMREHPQFKVYKNTLSMAGEDGSLQTRFLNTPLENNVQGKTGYLSGVRSISGYMTAASGQPLAFSVVTNNYVQNTTYIDYLQETILKQIYKKH